MLGQLGLDIYTSYSVTIAFELPVNVFCILTLDTLGRRWPNAVFMLVGGIFSIAMWFLRDSSDTWTLVMATVLIFSFAASYNTTAQVASELFPTVIRGRAVLLQRMLGDVGSVLGTQIASLATLDTYLPMLVTGCLSLVASVLVFLLPETVGTALPQTIEDGECYGRGQGLCFCPLFNRDSDAPGHEIRCARMRIRTSLFRKNLPVTQQPAVNRAYDSDSMVVPTIYSTIM
ncbi:hypothetical protein V5799_030131 [Amblyomma americanum]|uniref:Major facilitator superfamily (MFS) profile domain-containing protein n=1 Tax=Amblyomma americanum TaxID=6943 RepID=A0AAQ4EP78_AMBAM